MREFTQYEIADINRAMALVTIFEGSDLVDREFTKKEFDKVFKGIASLDWVRENGNLNGRVHGICPYDSYADTVPFVTLVRVEDFEMPYKADTYRRPTEIAYLDGKKVDINIRKYKYDSDYRAMVTKAYGEIEIRTETPDTFTAHRNFYKVNLEALKGIEPYSEECRAYYTKRLEKACAEVARLEKALSVIG